MDALSACFIREPLHQVVIPFRMREDTVNWSRLVDHVVGFIVYIEVLICYIAIEEGRKNHAALRSILD